MSSVQRRNPGPPGGYRVILAFHRYLPRPLFRASLAAGNTVCYLLMHRQRKASRTYLEVLWGRCPSRRDVWMHFYTFSRALTYRLLAGAGLRIYPEYPEGHGEAFFSLLDSGRPALFGTFHIGCSDLLGFLLSEHGREVNMVRLKVGNSVDTERLAQAFPGVRILWVNDRSDLLLGMKEAIDKGGSLAIQCDRIEHASRHDSYQFLGSRRLFPSTIYHLSALYRMPVAFCFCILDDNDQLRTFAPPVFEPQGSRKEVLEAGRHHFQSVLAFVENLLRKYPLHWFNFSPLNPPASSRQFPEPSERRAGR